MDNKPEIISPSLDTNAAVINVIPTAQEAMVAFNRATEMPPQYVAIENCITFVVYAACANGEMKARDAARMLIEDVWGVPKTEKTESVQGRFDLLLGELARVYIGAEGNLAENLMKLMDENFAGREDYRNGVLLFQKNAFACGQTENAGRRRFNGVGSGSSLYDSRINGSVLNSDQIRAFAEGWRNRVLPAKQALE